MLLTKKITHHLLVCSYVFAIGSKSLGQVPIAQLQSIGRDSLTKGAGGGLLSKCKLQNLILIHRELKTSKSFYLMGSGNNSERAHRYCLGQRRKDSEKK